MSARHLTMRAGVLDETAQRELPPAHQDHEEFGQ
jgi:putative ABC transport system ATP-binding protein